MIKPLVYPKDSPRSCLTSSLRIWMILRSVLSKFAIDTKLERVDESPKGHVVFQMYLNRLEKWEDRSIIEFNKGKCNVLHLGRKNCRDQYMLVATQLKRNSTGCISKFSEGSWRQLRAWRISPMKDLGQFHQEKRRFGEGFINVCKFLEGGYKEDGARIFLVVPSHGVRGNGHEPKCIKLPLNIRKCILTARHIQKLKILGHLVQVVLHFQVGWTWWSLKSHSNFSHSVILWYSIELKPCWYASVYSKLPYFRDYKAHLKS